MLVVFRIGSNIPVPGINRDYLAQMFTGNSMGLFELFNLFSGGSFNNFTIFALSITPYITATIIIQLLTIAFPYFERLAKEGMEGRKKMAQITRYLTVVLALVQALGLTVGLFRKTIIDSELVYLHSDHPDTDGRYDLPDVARRANQRIRYRKRYLTVDLRRHCCQDPKWNRQHVEQIFRRFDVNDNPDTVRAFRTGSSCRDH
jgi:hypothetical protein